jgi:hypothetical protein
MFLSAFHSWGGRIFSRLGAWCCHKHMHLIFLSSQEYFTSEDGDSMGMWFCSPNCINALNWKVHHFSAAIMLQSLQICLCNDIS